MPTSAATAPARVASNLLQTRLSLRAVPGESSGGDRPGYATGSLCRGVSPGSETTRQNGETHQKKEKPCLGEGPHRGTHRQQVS